MNFETSLKMYPLGSQASSSMLMSAASGNAFTQMLHVTGMPPYNPQIFTYPPCTSSFMATTNFQNPSIPVSMGFSAPQSPGFLPSQHYASVNQSVYPANIFNSQVPLQLWNQPQIPVRCQPEGMGHQRGFAGVFNGAVMRQQLPQYYNPPVLLPEGYSGSFGSSSQLRFIHQCAHERVTIQQSTQLYGNHVLNGPDMSTRGPLSTIFQACDSDLRRSSSSEGNEKQNSFIACSIEESHINQRVEIEELEQEDQVKASAKRLPLPLCGSSDDCNKGVTDSPDDELEGCRKSSEAAENHDAQNTDVYRTNPRSTSPMIFEHEPLEEGDVHAPKLHTPMANASSSVIKPKEKQFYQSQLSSATSIVLRRSQCSSIRSPLRQRETAKRQQWRRTNALRKRMITRGERPVLGRIRRKPPIKSYMKKTYRFSVSNLPKAATSEEVPKRKRGRPRKAPLPADTEAEEIKDNELDLFAESTEKNVGNLDLPTVSPSRKDKMTPDPQDARIISKSLTDNANEEAGKKDVVCFATLVAEDLPDNLSHDTSDCPHEIAKEDSKVSRSCNGKSDAFMKLMGLLPRELKSKVVEDNTATTNSPLKDPTVECHPPFRTPRPSPIKPKEISAEIVSQAASSPATPSKILRRSPRQHETPEVHQAKVPDVPLSSPSSSRPRGSKRITRCNERKVVFSNSTSDQGLRHINDRTLRLRVRNGGMEVNRKWKLKWDGPLFPKIPLSTAEKRLERYALARMQSWTLNHEVGETYLHRAAKEGDKDVVLYCLKFDGFHPRCTNNRGHTALHEACKAKDKSLEVAKILIDHGAYHSQPSRGNIRPLHVASREGNLGLVKYLLSLGADPHLFTFGDTNCFDLAESHPEVAQFLEKYSNLP